MARRYVALVIGCMLWAHPAGADDATLQSATVAMTLDEAVSLALRENYDIRSAYLERIRDRFALRVAHDKFNLHYNANVAAGYVWSNGPASGQTVGGQQVSVAPSAQLLLPTGATLTATLTESLLTPALYGGGPLNAALTLAVQQPLLKNFGWDVNMASVIIGDLQEHSNILALKNQLIISIGNVIAAYRTLTQSKLVWDSARKAVGRSRDVLNINHEMVAAGRMAPADLIQTESEIATREVVAVNAEANYVSAEVGLLTLLALPGDTDILPSPEPTVTHVVPGTDDAHAQALAHRPEYITNLLARDIAAKNLMLAQTNRLWDLELTAAHTRGTATTRFASMLLDGIAGPSNSTAVGLTLSIPLIDITLEQGVVNADVTLRQADVAIVQLRNNVLLQVDGALRNVRLQSRHFELAKRARALAESKLDNEREKLRVGRSSNFQVLQFVDDLANAEVAEITTTITYLNAATQLEVQMGQLLDRWDIQLQ